ncbi:alpha-ketoglutarate-dependent dioxygenase AlkB [Candidatus Uabimicrobium amorphum]|uniref:Alpha-ketoglutarate-dependent dioxygenase AlkB n=1 Tax=Uabimicrobium amorphum TaxID=2596890 RepID=A0A5S9IJ77_UABAM|nr:alpha-ketoglutarate-dependent dioxygenase AlkB [Candidatus Uabimicrobium amorphum]BBM82704.1 alpha-ketoglutarate-dependent dioxygenase AlkB [Candidatus Uabimicrobium amorphum]
MDTQLVSSQQAMEKIPGLYYIANYLDEAQQQQLITTIDNQQWIHDLHRRTQHYGYRYFFKTGMIYPFTYLGKFPEWLHHVAENLYHNEIVKEMPQQALINEYLSGQGIGEHVDTIACFGEEIVSLSLVSQCFMTFKNKETKEKVAIVLEPGSMVAMKDIARYKWSHGIKKSEVEVIEDREIVRDRRVAITLRTAEWKPFSATRLIHRNSLEDILSSLLPQDRIVYTVGVFSQKLPFSSGEWYSRDKDFLYVRRDANINIVLNMIREFHHENLYFINPQKNICIHSPKNHLINITAYKYENFVATIEQLRDFIL